MRNLCIVGLCVFVACGMSAHAGNLTPPAGPVAPTLKTLVDVEPRIMINADNTPGDADSVFKITSSGSYYLRGNLTVILAESAIEIAADDVTLDLNGFEIRGFDSGSLNGIVASHGSARNIRILNGSITGFGGSGIDLPAIGDNCMVQDVRVSGCGGFGIRIGGQCHILNCAVEGSGDSGFDVGSNSVLDRCTAKSNGGVGFFAGSFTSITACRGSENTSHGVHCGSSCSLESCAMFLNGGYGFLILSGSAMALCSADANDLAGIRTTKGCLVVDCTSWQNREEGILIDPNSIVKNCVARENSLNGIETRTPPLFDGEFTSVISGCTSGDNTGHGILALKHCLVEGNVCESNGLTGIRVEDEGNRIENNVVLNNPLGLHVVGDRNLILRNSAKFNSTNYEIVVNNRYGAILSLAGAGGAAVSGSAAASNLGSVDPWANFSH